MNIFYPSHCNLESALALPNLLVNKMQTEYVQLMSSGIRLNGIEDDGLYQIVSNRKHQSVVCITESYEIFDWLSTTYQVLAEMYTEATNKVHGSYEIFLNCQKYANVIPTKRTLDQLIPACGEFFNNIDASLVEKYKRFMVNDKHSFADWGKYGNKRPDWWTLDRFDYNIAWELQTRRNKTRKKPVLQSDFDDKVRELYGVDPKCLKD